MKVIEFENFYCIIKSNPSESMEFLEKVQVKSMKEDKYKAENRAKAQLTFEDNSEIFSMPNRYLEDAQLDGDLELEIMKNAIIATKSEMTALQVLETINSLEEKIHSYYRCLFENFMEDVEGNGCDCLFCREIFTKKDFILDDYMDTADILEAKTSILEVSEEKRKELHGLGLCLAELNFALMEDEVVYCGSPNG